MVNSSGTLPAQSAAESASATRIPRVNADGLLGFAQQAATGYVSLLRRRHPEAAPAQILHVVNKQFLLGISLGGTGTGLATLRLRGTFPLLGVSAAHAGLGGSLASFYLLARAEIYNLGPADTRRLLSRCAFGHTDGGILEQQFARTWWRSAVAYLPASQVRFVRRIADRSLRRATRIGTLSPTAGALPAGIGSTIGFASGRILGNRVIAAATEFLGSPPSAFGDVP